MSKFYNIKRHVDRLYWRVSNGNFTPNQNDVEAIDNIVDFTNDCLSNEKDQNKPFQKLYVHLMSIYTNHYENVHTAQNKLHEILGLHIEHQYTKFAEDFNRIERNQFLESIGVDIEKSPLAKSEDEALKDAEIVKANSQKWLKYLEGKWEYSKIKKSLNTQLVGAYHQFKSED